MTGRFCLLLLLLAVAIGPARAEIRTEDVTYVDIDNLLQGYVAWDDTAEGPRPGVLIAHAWKGPGEYEKRRARELAQLGYVAFALDLYGKEVRPETSEEAGKLAGLYRGDRPLMRRRAQAGLDALAEQKLVDRQRLAAIGYCFGGTVVLELARSGAPLGGVVSFHGNLDTPTPQDAKNIKGKVLILHGAADPHVPPEQVAAFEKEMRDAGVDWKLIPYEGAAHAFSDPGAGNDPSRGAAYNADADRQSWQAMTEFLEDVFKP